MVHVVNFHLINHLNIIAPPTSVSEPMPSETILSPGAKSPTHLPKLEPPRKKEEGEEEGDVSTRYTRYTQPLTASHSPKIYQITPLNNLLPRKKSVVPVRIKVDPTLIITY